MKLNKYIFIGTIAVAGLSSCVSETISEGKVETGKMLLDVSLLNPQPTRAGEADAETALFPVSITQKNGEEVKSYNTVLDVPQSVVLPVGDYVVASHTPGEIQKQMTAPYYAGEADLEIVSYADTQAEVVCKMQNSSITFKYDESFLSTFTEWTITLNDGGEQVLSYTHEDGEEPETIYWWFGDDVNQLTLDVTAKTEDGKVGQTSQTVEKPDANQQYDDDNDEFFTGGDVLEFNFAPVSDPNGNLTGIDVKVVEKFFQDNEVIEKELDVTDNTESGNGPSQGGDDPDPTPGGDEDNDGGITLNLPAPIVLPYLGDEDEVDKSKGDTEIAAEKGLKSIIVKMESTNDELIQTIPALAFAYGEGLDFVEGVELIDNDNVTKLFQGLTDDETLFAPVQGSKNYTFPVGTFFQFLLGADGKHTFSLTVTDMEGHRKSGQVVITVE